MPHTRQGRETGGGDDGAHEVESRAVGALSARRGNDTIDGRQTFVVKITAEVAEWCGTLDCLQDPGSTAHHGSPGSRLEDGHARLRGVQAQTSTSRQLPSTRASAKAIDRSFWLHWIKRGWMLKAAGASPTCVLVSARLESRSRRLRTSSGKWPKTLSWSGARAAENVVVCCPGWLGRQQRCVLTPGRSPAGPPSGGPAGQIEGG